MMESVDRLRGWLRDGNQGAAIVHTGGTAAVNDVQSFVNKVLDEIEQEVAERYMELPVDADGVPIRPGDEMENGKGRVRVKAVTPDSFFNSWGVPLRTSAYRHHTPPTVEDVLREFAAECVCANDVRDHEVTDAIAEYAARLALREGADG